MLRYIGINGRNDIPRFLMEENLGGPQSLGVEIGTHLGEYAKILLDGWDGILRCVDPYENAENYSKQAATLWGGVDRITHRKEAAVRLKSYIDANRCLMSYEHSIEAVGKAVNNTLSFVYIDGNHEKKFVFDDLLHWWVKIKPGGYMFGHDFITPGEVGCSVGIQEAIDDFVEYRRRRYGDCLGVCPIPEGSLPWSFAIQKPSLY
jgi:hypothetical protein